MFDLSEKDFEVAIINISIELKKLWLKKKRRYIMSY
jgi:hypothetical protein